MRQKPYVVSGDIYLLLKRWTEKQGLILPSVIFFNELRQEMHAFLQKIFEDIHFIEEEELSSGLRSMIGQIGIPAISLDGLYCGSPYRLEVARSIDESGKDKGIRCRAETRNVLTQLNVLRKIMPREIILIDDVIFSGSLVERVIHIFSRADIRVVAIICGVGIGEGVKRLQQKGFDIKCVRYYPDVIDEICERDFYPGVPLSGRRIVSNDNIGAPYILPFGNPRKWASIPESWEKVFSMFCIQQAIKLFEEIERVSNKIIYYSDVERKILPLPEKDIRFVDALKCSFRKLADE